jgi:isopentenyldiphosphate isomerase
MIVYHHCKLDEGKPQVEIEEKDEVEEIKWVKPEELYKYFTTDIDPEVKKFLKI